MRARKTRALYSQVFHSPYNNRRRLCIRNSRILWPTYPLTSPSPGPYRKKNLICCRSKYVVVVRQSEKKNPSVLQIDSTCITTFTVGCCSQRMIRHKLKKTHHNTSSKRYMQRQIHIIRDFSITCEYDDFSFLRCDSVQFGRNSSRFCIKTLPPSGYTSVSH